MEQVVGVRDKIVAAVADLSQHFSSTWVQLLTGVVAVVIAVIISNASWKKKSGGLPPGPRNWPIIGAILEMEPLLHKTLDKFAAKYGGVVYFRLGVQTVVAVSSAEAAEELLKQRDAEFSDRATKMSRSAAKYVGIDAKVMPFANYDAEFRMHRKIFMTETLTVAKIKTYEALRTQEIVTMVEKIFSVSQSGHSSKDSKDHDTAAIPVRLTILAMIQNVVYLRCFGKRFENLPSDDILRELTDIAESQLNILLKPNLADLFPWLAWLDPQGVLKKMKSIGKRHLGWHDQILESARQEMKNKRESGVCDDADEGNSRTFMQTLLRVQERGTHIADRGINSLVDGFLTAGGDTTSSQTEWTLLELARNPKAFQKLQQELDGVVGKERLVEEADLPAMPFLNAVILESLRLHGVGATSFPHVNLKPSTLCGYYIPANTAVILNSYTIGRDPKTWKDPLEFDPDRFMPGGSAETIKANGLCYSLLPFSSGRRICPGYNLAMILVSRTVGTLVHAFDWSLPPGCSPQDLTMDELGPIVIHPTRDLHLVPAPRLSPHVYKSTIS